MKELANKERFEDALALRNRLSAFARGVSRGQRIRALTRIPEIVVRVEDELLLIRFGRLASSAPVPKAELMEDAISSLILSGERIEDDESIIPAKNYEESEKLVRILEKVSQVLLIDESRGPWAMPTRGAPSIRHRLLENSSDASGQSEWIDRMSDNRIRS
jgi:DNA polymerase-3 subunit epsilon